MKTHGQRFLILCFCLLPRTAQSADDGTTATRLASDGRSLLSVIVAEKASDRIRQAADELANYLGKISEASFVVKTGDGRSGIAVGLPAQFPKTPFSKQWTKPTILQREDYLIHSHRDGIHVLGATELAIEHAVWDLLHRLGCRQFFPGDVWEVIPHCRELAIKVDALQSPSYRSRRIWYGYGPWDHAAKPYARWCRRNRATEGTVLSTGHAYGRIIRTMRNEFEKHPEYYALVDGKRQVRPGAKLCIGNPDLRRLVVRYAIEYFDGNPQADSVSMDPSDGGGWCECDACKTLGSVSNRAVLLANEVAEAIDQRFEGKLVGMYAYNVHSPPPTIRVHSHVVISVATAFLRGGLTLDEIIRGWAKQGATLGIREYYSVNTWDRDMPGRARGSNIDYLKRTIPEFFGKGARFLSAESSDNWGPNGLGYYLAARMLWDVDSVEQTDALIEDFLTRAFGPARAPIRAFYQQLDGSRPHVLLDDQLGRMFQALVEAKRLATSAPDVLARINDLILYARYVDLYNRYANVKGAARQAAFEQLIRHAYRMRRTMMVHTKALYRDLDARDKNVSIPDEARWNIAAENNPWKSSEPFTRNELRTFLSEGVKKHPPVKLDFKPVEYSENLVPPSPLKLAATPLETVHAGRGTQTFFTWVDTAPAAIELRITGGLIKWYRDRGNVRVDLWKLGGASETGERETHIAHDESVPPDGVERKVKLTAKHTGLHKITISDGGDMTRVAWTPGTPITVRSSFEDPYKRSAGRWSLYFYVPKGTVVIGLFGGKTGQIVDPLGNKAFLLEGRKLGYYSVPVPGGTDGKLWMIRNASGSVRLLTVPPYLARSAAELLLPKEVVSTE